MDERSRFAEPIRDEAPRRPPRFGRLRLRRPRWPIRLVAGLVLLAAVVLLWPFADWSWWPVVIGFGLLVLLYLLRLDRLLFGWAPHLAGLVVVVLMAARSDPWAWGLAAGLAVLGAGFVLLPRWRLLAAGALIVAVCGAGYGVTHYRGAQQQKAEQTASNQRQSTALSAVSPELLLPFLAQDIAAGKDRTVCPMFGAAAGQFASSTGAPDCAAAVHMLASQVTDRGSYADPSLPADAITEQGDVTIVDGCRASWSTTAPPGPRLGRFEMHRYQRTDRFLITGYAPCR